VNAFDALFQEEVSFVLLKGVDRVRFGVIIGGVVTPIKPLYSHRLVVKS